MEEQKENKIAIILPKGILAKLIGALLIMAGQGRFFAYKACCRNAQKALFQTDNMPSNPQESPNIYIESVKTVCRFSVILSMDFRGAFRYDNHTFCRGD
ncbi:MAG: hypothetical protein J5521_10790 [Lachnospiraceae bacterium]|nr:hypothetical protein [Lachnospiraceae bacterium]